jgi:hypothetical protein
MNKKTIVSCLAVLSCYLMITGYAKGPGANGWDCTGAETGLGNPTGCSASGFSCHSTSATSGIAISIELDSSGVPTTHYVGGTTYSVKISGTNNTTSKLPKFGLQMSSILGSVAKPTPVNSGTWTSPFPANTHYSAPAAKFYVCGVVEHSTQLAPASGTGGTGTTYTESFKWKAPAKGTGTVSIWGSLNAVNNNDTADAGDKWNNTHLVLNEWPSQSGIAPEDSPVFSMNVFPNPCSRNLNLQYSLSQNGKVTVDLYNLSGRKVFNVLDENLYPGNNRVSVSLPQNLPGGIYLLIANVNQSQYMKKIVLTD